jgi:hypothetical protein
VICADLRVGLPLVGVKIFVPTNGRPYADDPAQTDIRITK